MKKNIIKSTFFTVIFLVFFISINILTIKKDTPKPASLINIAKAQNDVIGGENGTERARYAYCQVMGDRKGCKDDPERTCASLVFCK